jgi:hypothetical protein
MQHHPYAFDRARSRAEIAVADGRHHRVKY